MHPFSPLPLFLLLTLGAACAHPSATQGTDSTRSEHAALACPEAVKQSVATTVVGATIIACKAEKEGGEDQFEVKLDKGGQKVEADVAPDGKILQIETVIAIEEVPPKVMSAFSSKYPGAKVTRAEKQVRPGKATYYEVKFDAQPKAKEATFAEDGSFVEEE